MRGAVWRRYALLVVGALLLAGVGLGIPAYYRDILALVLIYGIFAMSLDLVLGYLGLVSLGHSVYFGVASYTVAILAMHWTSNMIVLVPLGLLAALVTAAIFGLLSLRTSHGYYLMLSLALAQVVYSIATSWTPVTHGDDGLPNIPRPLMFHSDKAFFLLVVVVAIVAGGLMYLLVSSPFGYAMRGIRDAETRMKALGYNTWRYKYVSLLISAFFAGVAGELFLFLNQFVSPDALSVTLSAEALLMVSLGSAGTLAGSPVGAVVVVLVQNVLSAYTARWLLVIGTIYVLIPMTMPTGIVGTVSAWLRSLRSRGLQATGTSHGPRSGGR